MDRRTFLKASGAAVAVAAMPSLPAFGADSPKAWLDLVEWCKAVPNLQGYMTGAWTPELDLGDGTTWVMRAHTLVRDVAFSPEEACAGLKSKIAAYLGNGPEAVWWRQLPSLRAFWYLDEGCVTKEPDPWLDRVVLLDRPYYFAVARIAAFGGSPGAAGVSKEGAWTAASRAEFQQTAKAKCGIADTILRDPWGRGAPLPVKEWHAEPPVGAKMCPSASVLEWDPGESDWTTGKVILPKRGATVDRFRFLDETAA